jgi:hypothetical protein
MGVGEKIDPGAEGVVYDRKLYPRRRLSIL